MVKMLTESDRQAGKGGESPQPETRGPVPIQPDIDEAVARFDELHELAAKLGFDLAPHLRRLRDSLTPVFSCDVDESAAPATGYAVARYKLADWLEGALAALRAWDSERNVIGHI